MKVLWRVWNDGQMVFVNVRIEGDFSQWVVFLMLLCQPQVKEYLLNFPLQLEDVLYIISSHFHLSHVLDEKTVTWTREEGGVFHVNSIFKYWFQGSTVKQAVLFASALRSLWRSFRSMGNAICQPPLKDGQNDFYWSNPGQEFYRTGQKLGNSIIQEMLTLTVWHARHKDE